MLTHLGVLKGKITNRFSASFVQVADIYLHKLIG